MKSHRLCLASLFVFLSLASSVASQAFEFTNILSFDGTNGAEPWCKLIQGKDGVLYGTTYSGGASGGGTVFGMIPGGPLYSSLYTLHDFSFAEGGYRPAAGLLQACDGSLYGTTTYGGGDEPTNCGVIFQIFPIEWRPLPLGLPSALVKSCGFSSLPPTPPMTFFGGFTNLHEFRGEDGANPWAGPLVQGRDGKLYGTTTFGGPDNSDRGTIFGISTNGDFNSLYAFGGANGYLPQGGLVAGNDGDFYGTTTLGNIAGTIFGTTPNGLLRNLFSFNKTNGAYPFGGLVQGKDGNFYGTTTQGGKSYGEPNSVNGEGFGTIFRITTNGTLTTLFSFERTNGSYPYGPLMQASDGRLYGTTLSGGPYPNELFDMVGYGGSGTLFSVTTNGEFTSLYSFDKTNGSAPVGTPVQLADGSFYGTTELGGAYDLGTVYRFRVPLPPLLDGPTEMTIDCGPLRFSFVDIITNYNDTDLTAVWSVNGQPVKTNIVEAARVTFATFPMFDALRFGSNIVTLTVSDVDDNTASRSTIINKFDTTPPDIASVTAVPSMLWPPRSQMVNVRILAELDDCSDVTCKIISVECPGPASARRGRFAYWRITGDNTVALRAERGPGGRDRVYRITVQAMDSAGNVSPTRVITVTVPKNQPPNAGKNRPTAGGPRGN